MGNKQIRIITEQFLVICTLQIIFSHFLKIQGVFPNFFLLWILYLGWNNFETVGLFVGFFTGFIYDFLVKGTLGLSSFLLICIGYLNSFLPEPRYREKIIITSLFSFLYFALLTIDPLYGFLWKKDIVIKTALLFVLYNIFIVSLIEFWKEKRKWKRKSISVI